MGWLKRDQCGPSWSACIPYVAYIKYIYIFINIKLAYINIRWACIPCPVECLGVLTIVLSQPSPPPNRRHGTRGACPQGRPPSRRGRPAIGERDALSVGHGSKGVNVYFEEDRFVCWRSPFWESETGLGWFCMLQYGSTCCRGLF